MDRFFCPNLTDGAEATLEETESQHLTRVLRYGVGDEVEVFDGQGHFAAAQVLTVGKRSVTLKVGNLNSEPAPAVELILGVAAPKGDRLKWLVEKATELGVSAFVPLSCERSVVEPRETRLLKLEQTVIAACKQSRRNRLMSIRPSATLEEFYESAAGGSRLIADPGGASLSVWIANDGGRSGVVLCAIGPEGGLTEGELARAREMGAEAISLGRHLLRVETAAMAVAASFAVTGRGNEGPLERDVRPR